jgi:preprotein translocase subunit SecG
MGAAFGGSSQTLFGSRGAATFLSKLTTAAAILFMITSLSLAIYSVHRTSVMSSAPVKEAPAIPPADATSGPLTEQKPVAPGQGESQGTPAQTPETRQ